MNTKYTTDFILSFENTIQQKRFEEIEEYVRECKEYLQLYEDVTNRCEKVLKRIPITPEIQQIESTITIVKNRVKKWKMKKTEFKQNEKERKIIKPTEREMERLTKSMSLPVIKLDESKQRKAEHQLLVKEFEGQYYQMTKHTSGNALLLKLIEKANNREMEIIVEELDEHLEDLIIHQNGQYILPKIMSKQIDSINDFIISIITEKLVFYCCDLFGGYTIQKIAPYMKEKHIIEWLPILQENIYTLINNQHGNYVVQTLLKLFGETHSDFFFEGIKKDLMRICTTKIGCSVLTNAINNATTKQLQQLLPEIITHCKELLVDQFGNFILQHFIEKDTSIMIPLIDIILQDPIYYSNHKFSSNVIEKCVLQTYTQKQHEIEEKKKELINVLLQEKVMKELIDNQYGNFIIQAIIDTFPKNQLKDIQKIINKSLSSDSQFSYFIEKKLKSSQLL